MDRLEVLGGQLDGIFLAAGQWRGAVEKLF